MSTKRKSQDSDEVSSSNIDDLSVLKSKRRCVDTHISSTSTVSTDDPDPDPVSDSDSDSSNDVTCTPKLQPAVGKLPVFLPSLMTPVPPRYTKHSDEKRKGETTPSAATTSAAVAAATATATATATVTTLTDTVSAAALHTTSFSTLHHKTHSNILLEVCIDSLDAGLCAQYGGAGRVELCTGLVDGGLTPSAGLIRTVSSRLSIPVNVLIRARGGDFCYSEDEIQCMVEDIRFCRKVGVHGVVIGALDPHGNIDVPAVTRMVHAAKPASAATGGGTHQLSVTFHRAIDVVADIDKAMETLLDLGIDRILTSGGKNTALAGADRIRSLVSKYGNSIAILAGAGVSVDNVSELVQKSNVTEVHASARAAVESRMQYRVPDVFMGGEKHNSPGSEYVRRSCSRVVVNGIVAKLKLVRTAAEQSNV
jgi:copper homeostasis protein